MNLRLLRLGRKRRHPLVAWMLGSGALSVKPTLDAVLSEVHADHEYVRDIDQHGESEYWVADVVGDCEDFALVCRDRLKFLDVDADLVLCRTENGELHLVCSVGGWVLDNRYPFVMRRDDLDYDWLKLGRGGKWYDL